MAAYMYECCFVDWTVTTTC